MTTRPEDSRKRRRSRIAGANAWFRAEESARPVGERLVEDAFARRFAQGASRLSLIRALAPVLPGLGATLQELLTAHCVRHRAIDELLLAAIRTAGVRQVVVVGAGYDMRAWRFAATTRDVRWIEIDDPATQARKSARLVGLGLPPAIVRVAADLEREGLSTVLERAGFTPALPTCFVIEGLVHYLSAAAFESLLAGTRASQGPTHLLLTFIDEAMTAKASSTVRNLFRAMGERPRVFWSTDDLVRRLQAHDFRDIRCWDFAQQRDQFVPPEVLRARRPLEARWSQLVVAAVRDGAQNAPASPTLAM